MWCFRKISSAWNRLTGRLILGRIFCRLFFQILPSLTGAFKGSQIRTKVIDFVRSTIAKQPNSIEIPIQDLASEPPGSPKELIRAAQAVQVLLDRSSLNLKHLQRSRNRADFVRVQPKVTNYELVYTGARSNCFWPLF